MISANYGHMMDELASQLEYRAERTNICDNMVFILVQTMRSSKAVMHERLSAARKLEAMILEYEDSHREELNEEELSEFERLISEHTCLDPKTGDYK